jgi:hypothetical protein
MMGADTFCLRPAHKPSMLRKGSFPRVVVLNITAQAFTCFRLSLNNASINQLLDQSLGFLFPCAGDDLNFSLALLCPHV